MAVQTSSQTVEHKFVLTTPFADLLKTVGAQEKFLTLSQVLNYLGKYIESHKLYDVQNPRIIHCQHDQLGTVMGVTQFRIYDVQKLLARNMVRIEFRKDKTETDTANPSSAAGSKRKEPEPDGSAPSTAEGNKRKEPEGCDSSPDEANKKQRGNDSCSNSPTANQACTPSPAKDSSDKSSFLDEEEDEFEAEVEEQDTYSFEYEVESLESSHSDKLSGMDSDSDFQNVTHMAAIILCNDSDMEFWADASSADDCMQSSDTEMSEGDKWECSQCGSRTNPLMRYCQKCWCQRSCWLPERRDRHPPRRRFKRQLSQSSSQFGSGSVSLSQSTEDTPDSGLPPEMYAEPRSLAPSQEASSSQSTDGPMDLPGSSQESTTRERAADPDVCTICLHEPKNAVIIHGNSGHQATCYNCARQLYARRKRCPACRRSIQKVVRNFIL